MAERGVKGWLDVLGLGGAVDYQLLGGVICPGRVMSASPASETPASSVEGEDLPVGVLGDEGEERAAHRSPQCVVSPTFQCRAPSSCA